MACKKNRVKVIELLLRYGASIEATTEVSICILNWIKWDSALVLSSLVHILNSIIITGLLTCVESLYSRYYTKTVILCIFGLWNCIVLVYMCACISWVVTIFSFLPCFLVWFDTIARGCIPWTPSGYNFTFGKRSKHWETHTPWRDHPSHGRTSKSDGHHAAAIAQPR